MFVYPKYKVNNSYFTPLQHHFNGFEDVMLVDNPADIAMNKEWLVWGGLGSYALLKVLE